QAPHRGGVVRSPHDWSIPSSRRSLGLRSFSRHKVSYLRPISELAASRVCSTNKMRNWAERAVLQRDDSDRQAGKGGLTGKILNFGRLSRTLSHSTKPSGRGEALATSLVPF